MKKASLFVMLFIISLVSNMNNVFADCIDCDVNECESCGCVFDSSANICVYDNYSRGTVSCGNNMMTNIPEILPEVISVIYSIVQVLIPVLLIIFGSLDLVKGIAAQKEDEIKKGQQLLIKRLISAVLVFFVFAIVKFVISLIADNNASDIIDCAECFISNDCS